MLNAWPLDESHIDYVDGDAGAGIVDDAQITIDAASLESLNEEGGEENVATGDMVLDLDADLAEELDAHVRESLKLANELQPPFDQRASPTKAGPECKRW